MRKALSKAWMVWGIAALFYLYEMILRVAPSVMTENLMASFDMTSTMLGVLVSFYYYAYTLFQLPCGVILDKLGARNLIVLSALLCCMGSILFASSNNIHIAAIGRFLVGSGSACAFISCLQISTQMFPTKYFPILAGITNMMGTLGGLFGGMPVAKAVNNIGWENTTYCLAGIGGLIIILSLAFIPKTIKTQNNEKEKTHIFIIDVIKKIIKNPQIITAGIVAGLMYMPISAFSELWAIPFFMAKYHINNEIASLSSAVLFIGVSIGSVGLAFFARKIKGYVKTIRLSAMGTSLLFVPLICFNLNIYVSFAIVFAIGFFTGGQVINFTCAKNNAVPAISGTTLAFVNGIVMLIGSVFQPILGVFLDVFWDGKTSELGTRIYEISCYEKAILTLPICLICACAISFFMKETIQSEDA